ncbi:hypothetical protein ACFW5D_30190 [Streptomyces sp. NPDC058770]|uniref:hypothetical protein n=1 Tax=Streptomyces sp. NPDC058770 TaxID=3346631 RepID=UPI0036B6D7AA
MPSSASTAPPDHHQFRLDHLAAFLRESTWIQGNWNVYSDEHSDIDGVPYDEHDYALHQSRRDADIWHAFEQVRHSGKTLLATAEHQLQQIPADSIQTRWVWQLATLRSALNQLLAIQTDWTKYQDSLPIYVCPGTEAYEDAIAERNADAWTYLDDWTTHGQSVLEIHAAAQQAPSGLATAVPTRVPAPAARTGTVRR